MGETNKINEVVKAIANLVFTMEAKFDEYHPNPVRLRKLDEAQKEKYLLKVAKKNENAKRRFFIWLTSTTTPLEVEEDFYNRVLTELEEREERRM